MNNFSSNLTVLFALLAIAAVSAIFSIFTFWQNKNFTKLKKTFFTGKTARDLETIFQILNTETDIIKNQVKKHEKQLLQMQEQIVFPIQKIGVVRYNPFNDQGGNLSFSLALLDGRENGIILTSMHGREHNRIYCKKIIQGICDSQLTEEENRAISQARGITN